MKTLKTLSLSLLAFSTFSASQLSANITMTYIGCNDCTKVGFLTYSEKFEFTAKQNADGVWEFTFYTPLPKGLTVFPVGSKGNHTSYICYGPEQKVIDGKHLICNELKAHKQFKKSHSR